MISHEIHIHRTCNYLSLDFVQSDMGRRRDQEIQKLKKDLELVMSQHESSDASLKKKHQEALKELEDQGDRLKHDKAK